MHRKSGEDGTRVSSVIKLLNKSQATEHEGGEIWGEGCVPSLKNYFRAQKVRFAEC